MFHRSTQKMKYIVPMIVALLIETCLFNFPFWESLTFSGPINAELTNSNNVTVRGERYKLTSNETAFLQMDFSEAHIIKNIKLPIQTEAGDIQSLDITVEGKDSANSSAFVPYGSTRISSVRSDTQCVRIHPSGVVKSLRIKFNGQSNTSFSMQRIKLNVERPFNFSGLRFLILVFICYLFFSFRSSSTVYHMKLGESIRRERLIIALFILVQILIAIVVTRLAIPRNMFSGVGSMNDGAFVSDNNQYNHLANALLSGRASLDLPVPKWLPEMNNPYDAAARAAFSVNSGQPTYWDYAFFQGKYYSYFGVLPVLLTFLPFKAVTGMDLRTDYSVCFFAAVFVFSAVFMLYAFLRRYFADTSIGFLLLSSIALITGSSFLTQMFQPMIYSLPILCSASLTFMGIGCWLRTRGEDGRLSRWKLIIGAALISMNVLSRPIFIVATLFAFPIFEKEIFHERLFFSKKGLGNTLVVMVSFIPALLAAGIYNFVRFKSVFEFGASYNLTGFDMVHRSFSFAKTVQGLYMYFVQPLNITPEFPFIHIVNASFPTMSEMFVEPFFGSIFSLAPVALFIFGLRSVKQEIKQRNLMVFMYSALGLALLIVVADSAVASISMRYYGDFSWMIILVAISVCAAAMSVSSEHLKKKLLVLMISFVFLEIAINYVNLFSDGRYFELRTSNSGLFDYVRSWFLFLQ